MGLPPPLPWLALWFFLHKDLLMWSTALAIILVSVVAIGISLHWLVDWNGMLWVQMRRRLQQLRFYITTIDRRRVPLADFFTGVCAAYAACRFARQLTPGDVLQLALVAGFPPAAADALHAQVAAEQAAAAALQAAAASHEPPPAQAALQHRQPRQQQQQPQRRLPSVGIPAWRYRYFLWWLRSHLATLRLLRDDWEQQAPQLIAGFDVHRHSADALLFRRGKGTCLVRLGQEVGGAIVSLRPDKARLPEEERTPESYFGSVSAARLAGGAYAVAEQPLLPQRRKLREGSVVHVYVPTASLRLHGGLWGCLRRMRHTKFLLDAAAGEVVHTSKAFRAMQPGGDGGAGLPQLLPRELDACRNELLVRQVLEQRRRKQLEQEEAGTGAAAEAQLPEVLQQPQLSQPQPQLAELQRLLHHVGSHQPAAHGATSGRRHMAA